MARSAKTSHARTDPELVRANQVLAAGDPTSAIPLYRALVDRKPRLADAHYGLSLALSQSGDPAAALPPMREAVRLNKSSPMFVYALGSLLNETNQPEEAVECYTRAGWMDPSLADCHTDAAMVLERLGRLDEAATWLERALKADPTHERARVLKHRHAAREGSPDPETLRAWADEVRSVATSTQNPFARSLAWATLGDLCDAVGDAERAFEAFGRCNDAESVRQRVPPPAYRDGYLAAVRHIRSLVRADRAARWRGEEPDDGLPSPAFLVGFPRSGTTMTERALDAHPDLRSLEEKQFITMTMAHMASMLGLRRDETDADRIDAMAPAELTGARRHYWDLVAGELGGAPRDGEVILDKMPLTITDLPVVNRLFPNARVIVALRDPRDVILSCFRQHFRINLTNSFFLDLRESARLYEAVMGSWVSMRDDLSLDVMEARYEDTVSEFEPTMREMLAFLGLGWDDAVLSFHERRDDKKASWTPSYHAIRKSVSTRAVGRWKPYAAQLAPVLPTLEPFVEAFGYEPSSAAAGAG